MNTYSKFLGSCLIGALLTGTSSAAVLAGWEMNGLSSYGPSPYDATTIGETGYTVGGLTRGFGVGTGGTAAANGWGGNAWTDASNPSNAAEAIAAGKFVTFSLTVTAGYSMSIESIGSYNIRRSNTGPTLGLWQYSADGGTFVEIGGILVWGSNITATGNDQDPITVGSITDLQSIGEGSEVVFRVVNWGASGTGTWYFNQFQSGADLVINGTTSFVGVSAIPEPSSALAGVLIACGLLIRQRVGPKGVV